MRKTLLPEVAVTTLENEPEKDYRDLAQHYIRNGEISPTSRTILNNERDRLGLSFERAEAIESEVLTSAQRPVESPLQPVEDATTTPDSTATSEKDDNSTQNLETQPTSPGTPTIDSQPGYRERLQQYEQEFDQVIRVEFPPGEMLRQVLNQFQEELKLEPQDVAESEAKIGEAFQADLNQYKQKFSQAVSQGLPLDPTAQDELKKSQRVLRLQDKHTKAIEEQVLSEQSHPKDPSLDPSNVSEADETAGNQLSGEDSGAPLDLPSFPVPPDFIDDFEKVQPPVAQPIGATKASGLDIVPPGFIDDFEKVQPPVAQPIGVTKVSGLDVLQKLLSQREWGKADEETLRVMCELTKREEGWLDIDAILNFPGEKLREIDRLWGEATNEKFSFRIQQRLYSETQVEIPQSSLDHPHGAKEQAQAFSKFLNQHSKDEERALAFSKRVEWWTERFEFLKPYNQLEFDIEKAPDGHLPAYWFWVAPWWKSLCLGGIGRGRDYCRMDTRLLTAFMQKLVECGIK
jgi:hypothetical protein